MLTRDQIKAVRADLTVALAGVAAKHGFASIILGNSISFDPNAGNFTAKIQGVVAGGAPRVRRPRRSSEAAWEARNS